MTWRPGDLVAPVADRALRDLKARHPAPSVSPPRPQASATRCMRARGLEILEVEPEDVVPLDHVRVALADDARALFEQRALVEAVAAHDVAEAGRVGERDRDDPVAGPRCARKLVALGRSSPRCRAPGGGGRRDEPAERGSAGLQEILMDRVAEEAGTARRARSKAGRTDRDGGRARRALGPRPEARPPAQRAGALERIDREAIRARPSRDRDRRAAGTARRARSR